MWRQTRLLTAVLLRNSFGINEARFGKDPKKKRRLLLLGVTGLFVGLVLMFYVGLLSYAYGAMGMPELIPPSLFAVTSLIILFFTMFKSGSTIFSLQSYEKVIVLPVKPAAVVASRFLAVYLFNALISLLVILPGTILYSLFAPAAPLFYVVMILGALFIPLLPMTVATALGALIYAIAARLRHKNLFTILFSLALTFGALLLSGALSLNAESVTEIKFAELSSLVIGQLNRIYPPTALFAQAAAGSLPSFLLFLLLSVVLFSLFVLAVQWKFVAISTALRSSTARRNYVMQAQQGSSPLKAMYRKELRRYFSTSIYVLNTIVGYLLMVALSVSLLAMGPGSLDAALGLEGITADAVPFLMAMLCVMMPTTTSAISLEGKQWWIVKSLPLRAKTVMDGKLLVNLTVALPCYAVSEIFCLLALRPSLPELAALVLVPLLFLLFSSVAGLFVNCRMPMFQWESETTVVKQSGAVIVSLLMGFVSVAIAAGLRFLVPGLPGVLLLWLYLLALAAAAVLLYRRLCVLNLNSIG